MLIGQPLDFCEVMPYIRYMEKNPTMINLEVKGTLARLLATENLNIEHRAVDTAYFDIENRILCLPIWKDVSVSVYDMLVGHEVGHALYTPIDYGTLQEELPQDVLNVLEDVRVEKMMKRQYPGLSKSFYMGYTELDRKNFFDLEGKDISKMSLLDRINIHFKIGVIGNRTIVNFERDEIQFVNRAADTETFEDVVQLGKDLVEFLQLKQEQKQTEQDQSQNQPDTTQDGSNTTQNGSNTTQDEGDTTEGQSQGQSESESSTSSVSKRSNTQNVDETISETSRALTENQKQLVDTKAKNYTYLNIPQLNLQNVIVSYKVLKPTFDTFMESNMEHNPDTHTLLLGEYQKYKKNSIKTVNYLVKEFECKKSADQYSRSTTAKTGVIDTQKIHSYKYNDDVFKKVTNIPAGKNHGLVFYLDWSGSMASIMSNTIKQLYDLVWFCKKVNIPFRVYAFSDCSNNVYNFPGAPTLNKEKDLYISDSFRLYELISSKMNARILDDALESLYVNCDGYTRFRHDCNMHIPLSGTPLIETILSTPQVVQKFKTEEQIQKVNVVYLTDGESNQPYHNTFNKRMNSIISQPIHSQVSILRDPKTRYSCRIETYGNQLTNHFVKFISNIVDYNLLGFRLCSKAELRSQCNWAKVDVNKQESMWEKNKCAVIPNCGFNELYLMPTPKNIFSYWDPKTQETDDLEVKDSSSKSQLTTAFKKHMKNKTINKIILSKFVGQIA